MATLLAMGGCRAWELMRFLQRTTTTLRRSSRSTHLQERYVFLDLDLVWVTVLTSIAFQANQRQPTLRRKTVTASEKEEPTEPKPAPIAKANTIRVLESSIPRPPERVSCFRPTLQHNTDAATPAEDRKSVV